MYVGAEKWICLKRRFWKKQWPLGIASCKDISIGRQDCAVFDTFDVICNEQGCAANVEESTPRRIGRCRRVWMEV